ncbi:MAG: C4-type zinc ribbon domain-containing protein [Chloroflexota bacterium]
MTVAAQLFRLEQLDGEIQSLEGDLADLRRLVQGDPRIVAAEKHVELLRSQETAAAAQQRRLEGDLADVVAKMERDHRRLYGGSIVDPRELASLERELQHYGAQRDALEEQLYTAMELVERLQNDLATSTRDLDESRQHRVDDRPSLLERTQNLSNTIAERREEREALAGELDDRTLAIYTRLQKQSGRAVARISGGVCGSCRVGLPPKDVQHARAGLLATCTNCGRILYAG